LEVVCFQAGCAECTRSAERRNAATVSAKLKVRNDLEGI
jgi:hypothetical protein